ncbi:hypothetical protein N7U49_01025 [Streptomyces sp. AD2-2]|nr:hypothetical protein N7U49_01025 [Streptomyces sp. AD2-2]
MVFAPGVAEELAADAEAQAVQDVAETDPEDLGGPSTGMPVLWLLAVAASAAPDMDRTAPERVRATSTRLVLFIHE